MLKVPLTHLLSKMALHKYSHVRVNADVSYTLIN